MFGPRLTTVFASRWRAIWFAASILIFAYLTVPEAEAPPANGQVATNLGADGLTEEQREQAQKALAVLQGTSGS